MRPSGLSGGFESRTTAKVLRLSVRCYSSLSGNHCTNEFTLTQILLSRPPHASSLHLFVLNGLPWLYTRDHTFEISRSSQRSPSFFHSSGSRYDHVSPSIDRSHESLQSRRILLQKLIRETDIQLVQQGSLPWRAGP